MKFEKINDNKIKCILNRQDLETRNISILELASGSDNAHKFLAEVMAKAGNEVGFFVNGAPLMIEASPTPDGDIAVIITKVNKNDELVNTMNINITTEAEPLIDESDEVDEAEELRHALGNFFEFAKNQIMNGGNGGKADKPKVTIPPIAVRTYIFYSKEIANQAVLALKKIFEGQCELYFNPKSGSYYLVLHKGVYPTEVFNKVCNIMTEFGGQIRVECASEYYYREHYQLIYEGEATGLEIK